VETDGAPHFRVWPPAESRALVEFFAAVPRAYLTARLPEPLPALGRIGSARSAAFDPRSRRLNRLLDLDGAPDLHSSRPALFPVRRRKTALLQKSNHPLACEPTERMNVSLYKRGGVYWAYLFRNGVRHAFSTGTANRKRALKIEEKLKQELNDRRFQLVDADPTIIFAELAARFMASGSVRPHHIYHLKFLLPSFGKLPTMRITKSLAEEFRKKRKEFNPQIKDATINRDLSVLRHILYWAVDEQILAANPLARMKMARERRTRRQVLSVAEENLLLAAAKDHLYAMLLMALDTGMRRGEITSQRWEDVDFAQNVLYVTRSKTPEGESREIPLTERSSLYTQSPKAS
jgi:hypothetical protein